MERFLVYFSRVLNLIIKIVYRARFWMRNEMKISRYIYIYQVLSLSIWKLKFSYTELVAHSTKSFHFLGLTLCFQLNKEEEWREERKKNEKNKKKEMKERTSRKEEGAEGCVERLKMFHSHCRGRENRFRLPLDSGNDHCSARSAISAWITRRFNFIEAPIALVNRIINGRGRRRVNERLTTRYRW